MRAGAESAAAPILALKGRAVAALVLPVCFATVSTQLLALVCLPGSDGVNVSMALWPLIWLPCFFHCFLAKSCLGVLLAQGGASLVTAIIFAWVAYGI